MKNFKRVGKDKQNELLSEEKQIKFFMSNEDKRKFEAKQEKC